MPFVPAAPESRSVPAPPPAPIERELDAIHIIEWGVRKNPNDADPENIRIHVTYQVGYVEDSTFVAAETRRASMSGASVAAKLGQTVPANTTYYDAIKGALYELLVTEEHLPAGTVE